MMLSTRALLYSGLVFPGAGYFVVKKAVHGAAAFLITFVGLVVVMIEAFHKAQIIAEKIVTGAIPVEMSVIREQILITPGIFSSTVVSAVSIVIGLVWLVGMVHSWQIAKRGEVYAQWLD
ncbi:MAG: hypothetical protein COB33_002495 [Thiotrichaceae bacterium]|nr:hypothetical protein [Thiotrichaceae bacterium]PCI14104.1 MAG: hypothetical protein COB71_03930 [Thiotrichales bacterium]